MTDEAIKKHILYNAETGQLFLVSDQERKYPLGYPNTQRGGAWYFMFRYKNYYVHRVVWFLCKGTWPVHEIDHIDQNPANNRIENLRDVPHVVNCNNRRAKYRSKRYRRALRLSGQCP
jgi:hypothetical protein